MHKLILPLALVLVYCSSFNEVRVYKNSRTDTTLISIITKHESQELIGGGYLKSRPEMLLTISKTYVGKEFIEAKMLLVLTAESEVSELKPRLLLKVGKLKKSLKIFGITPGRKDDVNIFNATVDLGKEIVDKFSSGAPIKIRLFTNVSKLTYQFNELQVESIQKFSRKQLE